MLKNIKKIIFSLTIIAFLAGTIPSNVLAAENDLSLETNIDKTLEIPLTLKTDKASFYANANINPGDEMNANIVFKNSSKEDIQVRISEISDQLGTKKSAQLLEVLKFTLTTDGANIYSGSHKNVTTPVTQWITVKAGSTLNMKAQVSFPKEEADNRFQGAEMKVKYVFEARADIPLDESTTTTSKKNSETVKTGIEETNSTNPFAIGIIVFAFLSGFSLIMYFIITKKKKQDK